MTKRTYDPERTYHRDLRDHDFYLWDNYVTNVIKSTSYTETIEHMKNTFGANAIFPIGVWFEFPTKEKMVEFLLKL